MGEGMFEKYSRNQWPLKRAVLW